MNKIGDEGPLVELLDEDGKRAEFGPEYPLKIKIDALDGDLDHEEYKDKVDWTEEDYTKYIAKPRKGKGAILKGGCDILMTGGAVSVGHFSFADNSTTMRNKTYRLGARVPSTPRHFLSVITGHCCFGSIVHDDSSPFQFQLLVFS